MLKNVKVHIEKLPQSTIGCIDTQDFMTIINKLIELKENLQSEISATKVEIDTWIQILGVTSLEEIKELFDSLPNVSQYSEDQIKLLQEYHSISQEMNAHSHLSNCCANTTEDGDIILKFSSASPHIFRNLLVWITTTEDNEYAIKNHNFPATIPINKLEEKYFTGKVGTDELLKNFSTALHQYTWPLFHRTSQISKFVESELGKTIQPCCNDGLTQISFCMNLKDQEENRFTFEFVLKYHVEEIFPFWVTPKNIDNKKPPQPMQDSVDMLANEMQGRTIAEVLEDFLGILREQSSSSDAGSSSASTTLFEMF